MGLWRAVFSTCGALVLPFRAWAAPVVVTTADGACAGMATFEDRAARRGVRVVNEPGDGVLEASVRARPTASGAEGELVVRRGDQMSSRSLSAPSCDEVLDALAFALALAVEDRRSGTPEPSQPRASDAPRAVPAPEPARDRAPARPSDTSTKAPASRRLQVGAGAFAGALSGPLPSPAGTIGVYGELATGPRARGSVAARLGLLAALPQELGPDAGKVTFALQGAALDLCAPGATVARLDLRACARGSVGRVQALNREVSGANARDRAWASTSAAARATLDVGAHLVVELEGSIGPTLTRDAWVIRTVEIFRQGPWSASAALGLGVRLP